MQKELQTHKVKHAAHVECNCEDSGHHVFINNDWVTEDMTAPRLYCTACNRTWLEFY